MLGMVDGLIFEEYVENPSAFVISQNLYRRHLTASQRAQIVVEANEWEKPGGNRYTLDQSVAKTAAQMAVEADVSRPTIERAKQVSRAGRADEVIRGEKTSSEIIRETKRKKYDSSEIVSESCIYVLTNKADSDKKYVGKDCSFGTRIKQHLQMRTNSTRLINAIKEYGAENFYAEIFPYIQS